eukprot:4626924-Pyramimonas_sp.AAC.1
MPSIIALARLAVQLPGLDAVPFGPLITLVCSCVLSHLMLLSLAPSMMAVVRNRVGCLTGSPMKSTSMLPSARWCVIAATSSEPSHGMSYHAIDVSGLSSSMRAPRRLQLNQICLTNR